MSQTFACSSFQQMLQCAKILNKTPLQMFQQIYISSEQHGLELPFRFVVSMMRLPEYTGPHIIMCFTMEVYEKMSQVRHFQYAECHLGGMSSELAWCCVENRNVCTAWQPLWVLSGWPQNWQGAVWTDMGRSTSKRACYIVLFPLKLAYNMAKYLAEVTALFNSSDSQAASCTHRLGKQ